MERRLVHLGHRIADLSGASRSPCAIGLFIFATVSGIAVQRATLPILRLLEGYWPSSLDSIRRSVISTRRSRRIDELQGEREGLGTKVA